MYCIHLPPRTCCLTSLRKAPKRATSALADLCTCMAIRAMHKLVSVHLQQHAHARIACTCHQETCCPTSTFALHSLHTLAIAMSAPAVACPLMNRHGPHLPSMAVPQYRCTCCIELQHVCTHCLWAEIANMMNQLHHAHACTACWPSTHLLHSTWMDPHSSRPHMHCMCCSHLPSAHLQQLSRP